MPAWIISRFLASATYTHDIAFRNMEGVLYRLKYDKPTYGFNPESDAWWVGGIGENLNVQG